MAVSFDEPFNEMILYKKNHSEISVLFDVNLFFGIAKSCLLRFHRAKILLFYFFFFYERFS